MAGPSLFLCYAAQDEAHAQRLEQELVPLSRSGAITAWRRLLPGDRISTEQERDLLQADLVVLLVSVDLISQEERWALYQRARQLGKRIVPLLVRPSPFSQTDLKDLVVLPRGGKPVTSWDNQEEAWADIGSGLAALLAPAPGPVAGTGRRRSRWGVPAAAAGVALALGAWRYEPLPEEMVRLPGGPFTLAEPFRDARQVAPYALDRDEVTEGEYLAWLRQRGVALAGQGARDRDGVLLWQGDQALDSSRLPVRGVTYEGARRYCAEQGKRLPRYEEWDLAARGTDRMGSYPWGEGPPTCTGVVFGRKYGPDALPGECAEGTGRDRPSEVGGAAQDRSAEGVRDLAGNVSEWVEARGERRYSRGGSFAGGAEGCRSGYYTELEAGGAYADVGFRCARDVRSWGLRWR